MSIVREQLAKAKAAEQSLRDMARWQKPPKPTAKLGIISASIVGHRFILNQISLFAKTLLKYRNKPQAQLASKNCLNRLPNELQLLVWSHITDQPDRLMLALTCKWNAAMYESLKGMPQDAQKKKASPKNKSTVVQVPKNSAKKPRPATISIKDRFAVMYRLQPKSDEQISFMPKKFRLCYNCLRFIPRSYIAASRPKGKGAGFGWSGKHLDLEVTGLKPKEVKAAMSIGYHCPDCVACAAFETVQMKKEAEQWKKVVERSLKA